MKVIECDLCKKTHKQNSVERFRANKKALQMYGRVRNCEYVTHKWIYMDVCQECLGKLFEAYRDEQEG